MLANELRSRARALTCTIKWVESPSRFIMKSALTFTAVLLLTLTTGPSWGAEPSRATEAERLFREGRALVERGDFKDACVKFTESEKLDPAPGTLLSLADCEEHERHIVKAREHYQLAASGFPKNDPRRNFANGRAVALEKRIAHVTYHLVAEGAIRVNDVVLSRSDLDVATATDPGEVRVEVTAAGHHPKTMTVTLAEGETRTIECELGPPIEEAKPAAPPLPTPTAAPPHKSSDLRRPLAFAALGVGGVSLVVGGVTGLLAANNASTVKDHCDPNYVCDQEGVDAASAGQLFAPLSTITLVAGVVLVGTGAFLYFTSGKSAPKKVGLSEHLKAGGFVW